MDDLVQDATRALLPFLGAGAGAAAHGFAEETGASLSDATVRIITRIRQRLTGVGTDESHVADVLREALGEGQIASRDLQNLVTELGPPFLSQRAGRDIYNGPVTIRTIHNGPSDEGDAHG